MVEAVESGWFARGGATLEVGCGQGDAAAWLATKGFPVVAIDIAEPALVRARARHAVGGGRLRFEQHDICAAVAPAGPHVNIAPEARLLLFAKAFRDGAAGPDPREPGGLETELARVFDGRFAVERVARTWFDRFRGARPEAALPGLAFWLRRGSTRTR